MPTDTWHNLPPRRREQVLRAAMAEFGRHGYSAGSLNVIAREAKVAKGSLFRYFDDKLDLFCHVAEETSRRIRDAMLPWWTTLDPTVPLQRGLVDVVDAWMVYFAHQRAPRCPRPAPLATYLDRGLLAHDVVWATAGHPRAVFAITPADLRTATQAEIVSVTTG